MFKLTRLSLKFGDSAILPDKEDLIFVQTNATSISLPVQCKKENEITLKQVCFSFQLQQSLKSLLSKQRKYAGDKESALNVRRKKKNIKHND